jgi:hypothetical protein
MRNAAAVAIAVGLIACQAQQPDAVKTLDDHVFAAGAVDFCDPTFNWKTWTGPRADSMGRAAAQQLLAELERAQPGNPENASKADGALKKRIEAGVTEGRLAAETRGCADREIRARMKVLY